MSLRIMSAAGVSHSPRQYVMAIKMSAGTVIIPARRKGDRPATRMMVNSELDARRLIV